MKNRLMELRKVLKLNQSEFSEKIGIGQGAYSKIETGETKITEQNIKLICLTFEINEKWLRYGAGTMFIDKDIAKTPEEKEILSIFRRLSDEMKGVFLRLGRDLLGTSAEKQEKPPENEKRA